MNRACIRFHTKKDENPELKGSSINHGRKGVNHAAAFHEGARCATTLNSSIFVCHCAVPQAVQPDLLHNLVGEVDAVVCQVHVLVLGLPRRHAHDVVCCPGEHRGLPDVVHLLSRRPYLDDDP